MNENRSVKRFGLPMPAVVSSSRNGKMIDSVHMVSKNISSAGAFFITAEAMEPGREVNIALKIPNLASVRSEEEGAMIQLKGKIVRTEPDGIAVAFSSNFKLSPAKKTQIWRD